MNIHAQLKQFINSVFLTSSKYVIKTSVPDPVIMLGFACLAVKPWCTGYIRKSFSVISVYPWPTDNPNPGTSAKEKEKKNACDDHG